LGGTLATVPAAVSRGPNLLDVVATVPGGAGTHKSWNGHTWSAYDSLGGVFTSKLALSTWKGNSLDVFGRGTDNHLYTRSGDGTTFGGFRDLDAPPGGLNGPVAAVDWGTGRM
jgi:hypothetical protein